MSVSIDIRMIEHSGIGTYIKNLIPLVIAAFPDTKFNLLGNKEHIDCYGWCAGKNVRTIHCSAPIYSLTEQIELVRNIPPDTCLFWSPHYNIPVLYGGKLLVTVHDVLHLAMPQFVKGIHKQAYAKAMFWAIRKKAQSIICVSNFTSHELMRHAAIDQSATYVTHLGVNPQLVSMKKSIGVSHRKYLLYVGNVKPHKNLVNLLTAFSKIKAIISEYDIMIVGKKNGFITGDAAVEQLASQLGNRVIFTGHVNDSVLAQYYANAAALVFPSLYEGFGLPPVEAMACGCPVIVSNQASLPEVCGNAALYCDPYNCDDIADKIMSLLTNTDLNNTMIARGVVQAGQYTWDKCAAATCAIIEQNLRRTVGD